MTKSDDANRKKHGLNLRQEMFCLHYIETNNASEAARRAGYSLKTAPYIGAENLKKPKIIAYIADFGKAPERKDAIASAEEVLQILTDLARGTSKGAALVGVGKGEERIENEMLPTNTERHRAAEALAKYHALFTDKHEVTSTVITVVDDI